MTEITEDDADFAYGTIEYFRDWIFEEDVNLLPEPSAIFLCASVLIEYHNLQTKKYWPSKISEPYKAGKGISFGDLAKAIEPLYLRVSELREAQLPKPSGSGLNDEDYEPLF
jgi:hypothetical protein